MNNDDREYYLTGGCTEFARQYVAENGGEMISVFVDGYPFHVAVVTDDGKFVDATGEWDSEEEWLSALREAMEEYFPTDNWDGVYEWHEGVVPELKD